jgi:ubiquinone/menaquinone biosynthesis C-methylase UbiE
MDYEQVTEIPGLGATREQMSMLYTRYRTAAAFCEGKDVLQVACGAGQGLGYLAAKACRVVGGDYTARLLNLARSHYRDRIPLVRLDAHKLPFRDQTFEVVILYEAIYYTGRARSVRDRVPSGASGWRTGADLYG